MGRRSERGADQSRAAAKRAGRPPGITAGRALRRRLEERAIDALLGSGSAKVAAEKLIHGIVDIAYGKPVKVGRMSRPAPIKERLSARIWLAERRFGKLPQPLEHAGEDGKPMIVEVISHAKAPVV